MVTNPWKSPEVDKGEWFELEIAVQKINPAQADLIRQLEKLLEQN